MFCRLKNWFHAQQNKIHAAIKNYGALFYFIAAVCTCARKKPATKLDGRDIYANLLLSRSRNCTPTF